MHIEFREVIKRSRLASDMKLFYFKYAFTLKYSLQRHCFNKTYTLVERKKKYRTCTI